MGEMTCIGELPFRQRRSALANLPTIPAPNIASPAFKWLLLN